jgi:hypothetical protein
MGGAFPLGLCKTLPISGGALVSVNHICCDRREMFTERCEIMDTAIRAAILPRAYRRSACVHKPDRARPGAVAVSPPPGVELVRQALRIVAVASKLGFEVVNLA